MLSVQARSSGEGDRLGAGNDLFHHLSCSDDAHAFCQLVFGDAAGFGAGAAEPHLALVGDELSHESAELRQPSRLDALIAAFASQTYRFDRASTTASCPAVAAMFAAMNGSVALSGSSRPQVQLKMSFSFISVSPR